eukprot:TRINITY_DN20510_c0_g1_i1.p1 TRINITY_DN20510_c0_g1~~TRINITY_DN20510_c0_g1_i1.p1  ORF type:complete len:607 (-),score=117.89 TRINITY_DN20510_c0_g1_i1:46-1632(-)
MKMNSPQFSNFLGSSLSVVYKKFLKRFTFDAGFVSLLKAMHKFAVSFKGRVSDDNAGKVVGSMISGFLFKVLQHAYAALDVSGLELEKSSTDAEQDSKPSRSPARDSALPRIRLRLVDGVDAALPVICDIARDAAWTSPKPLHRLLEDMDVTDATGDGGGDLEVAALGVACYACLHELHDCWRLLMPQVLPIGVSAARRANVLLRAASVLIANDVVAPQSVSLADLGQGAIGDDGKVLSKDTANSAHRRTPKWGLRGFALLSCAAVPTLRIAAAQNSEAYKSPSTSLCRWYPQRALQSYFEALTSTADIDRGIRGVLFNTLLHALRVFEWPSRFELYVEIVQKSRIDSIIGALVSSFKEDWWPKVCELDASSDELRVERSRLVRMLLATLDGDIKIVDGMDTLTAALNIVRLVALAKSPAAAFLRESLRRNAKDSIDLDAMLKRISGQIDIEVGMLSRDTSSDPQANLAAELARQLGEAADVNVEAMKRDRITMVAHLVARVRELLSEANAAASAAAEQQKPATASEA